MRPVSLCRPGGMQSNVMEVLRCGQKCDDSVKAEFQVCMRTLHANPYCEPSLANKGVLELNE